MRARGAGNIHAIPLPLISERLRPRGPDTERDVRAGRDGLIAWLRRDARRVGHDETPIGVAVHNIMIVVGAIHDLHGAVDDQITAAVELHGRDERHFVAVLNEGDQFAA